MRLKWSAGLLLLSFLGLSHAAYRLQERFFWNILDYNYPTEEQRQQALISGDFIPENGLPVGIEVWGNKLFVSVPRWRGGIPSTLNYVPLDQPVGSSPRLTPYPSLANNELGNCQSGLNTVYRIKADKCNRLWVLDTGTFGIGNTTTNPCPYAINVFDLTTDTRIRRYEFRAEDTNANTFIANIAIDIGSSCDDTFAYFSDELGYGLIAYSWQQNKSWRFSHSYFMPDPLAGDFNVAGLNFQWGAEGIFGITLSPIRRDGFRILYFSPLASNRLFAVSTRILRDENRVENSYHDFRVLDSRAPNSHVTSQVMDDNGLMLFNLIDQNAVGCWNSELPHKPQNHALVDKDDVGLVFPSDVKIDDNNIAWVISDRMPVFLESTLDFSDINFRIYSAPVSELIRGTLCESVFRRPILQPGPIIINSISQPNYLSALGFPIQPSQIINNPASLITQAPIQLTSPISTLNDISQTPFVTRTSSNSPSTLITQAPTTFFSQTPNSIPTTDDKQSTANIASSSFGVLNAQNNILPFLFTRSPSSYQSTLITRTPAIQTIINKSQSENVPKFTPFKSNNLYRLKDREPWWERSNYEVIEN